MGKDEEDVVDEVDGVDDGKGYDWIRLVVVAVRADEMKDDESDWRKRPFSFYVDEGIEHIYPNALDSLPVSPQWIGTM